MKNLWLEVDEPRKHFFNVAYRLLANVERLSRIGKMEELYALYAAFVKAYKKLDILLRLYDKDVMAVYDGADAALSIYCHGDDRLNAIFMKA